MTDPQTPSGPGDLADDVGGAGSPDDPSAEGLVLGEMTTPGAGDAASTWDTEPDAFYTHRGTPCG